MISISPGGIDLDIALGLEKVIRNMLDGGFTLDSVKTSTDW